MTSESPIVHIEKVSHYFGHGEARRQVLFENSLVLEPGEIAILTGPSGSGKTTLLTLIGGLRSVQEGSVRVLGRELRGLDDSSLVQMRRDVGFIFQLHNLFESLSALENVMMAAELKPGNPREMEQRAQIFLDRVGLSDRVNVKPGSMSGGQRQRVSIARALVNAPRLILADERASRDRCSVLIVTHDSRILDAADRIIHMVDGRIVSDARVKESVRICEFLLKCPPFERMTPTAVSDVAEKMKHERFPAGAAIIRQGEEGDKFFIIHSGTVAVFQENVQVATLGESDFFGEAALMSGGSRNATVIASTDAEFYTLGKAEFHEAIESSESFKEQLLKVLSQRS